MQVAVDARKLSGMTAIQIQVVAVSTGKFFCIYIHKVLAG